MSNFEIPAPSNDDVAVDIANERAELELITAIWQCANCIGSRKTKDLMQITLRQFNAKPISSKESI